MFRLAAAVLTASLLTGCVSSGFHAVSADRKSGGIYEIRGNRCVQLVNIPLLNYLICDSKTGLYYGTANGGGKKMGTVHVLRKKEGVFQLLQSVSAGGVTPCHIAVSPDGRFLYTANYSSGDVSEFRLENGLIASPARLLKHAGASVTKRQRSPHPHFVGFDPAGKQLFVSDLGTDEVWIYSFSQEKGALIPCSEKLSLSPGAGPRHLFFAPSGEVFYTANELNSTVSSFARKDGGAWRHVQTLSTLPSPRPSGRNAPGAIKGTACGGFFWVTNRGHNSIAFFKAGVMGDFRLADTVPSGGDFPSDLLLFENEEKLAVIHLKSGTVSFFAFDRNRCQLKILPGNMPAVFRGIGLCR